MLRAMSGLEPVLAGLFASAGTAGATAGTAAATTAATTAAATGAGAIGGAAAGAAGAAGLSAATSAAAAGGLTALEIASLGGTAASLAGTGAQLLADKPQIPGAAPPVNRDDAQAEADRESELLKRRGRAAALLTAGRAKGDTSTPSLGAAALLGA